MIHILEIPKAREYDNGTIRVVAKNPLGEAECSSSLTVIPAEDWRSRLKKAPRCTFLMFRVCVFLEVFDNKILFYNLLVNMLLKFA